MVHPELVLVKKKVSGWWGIPTPLKNDGVKVSWDDEIPNIWKVIIHSCSKPPTSYLFMMYHVWMLPLIKRGSVFVAFVVAW